jgi:hypothetical protein
MSISTGQLRWMGLGAIVGGALIIGVRVVDVLFDHPGRVVSPSGNSLQFSGPAGALILSTLAALALLSTLGVLGLNVQRRRYAGRSGTAGFVLLLVGNATTTVALALQALAVALDLSSPAIWVMVNLLMIPAYVLLIPIGFLLVGVRLPTPWRYLAFSVGLYLLVQPWMPRALRASFPIVASLFGSETSSLVLGLGAAIIGCALWSSTRGTFWLEPHRLNTSR